MSPAEMVGYLIDWWSYSSLVKFLRNPIGFKMTYIDKIYGSPQSVAAAAGEAAHAATAELLLGAKPEVAVQTGYAVLTNKSDLEIKWGLTGTREGLLKIYAQAVNNYMAELPEFGEIIIDSEKKPMIEKTFLQFIRRYDQPNGQTFAIPAKAKLDVVARNASGAIVIHDHKFVKNFTKDQTDKAMYRIQAMFAYHTVREELKEAPAYMIFHECKIPKNEDGSPQVQSYVIDFAACQRDFDVFYRLYDDATRLISLPGYRFLPNPSDIMEGDEAYDLYAGRVVEVEAPMLVLKKTAMVAPKERRYVASAINREENKHMTPGERIRVKLGEFGIALQPRETLSGGSIIKYTFVPERGVSMAKIKKYAADLALALEAPTVRIEAPIPGTNLVGVEVPNPSRQVIRFDPKEKLEVFGMAKGTLNLPIGVDVYGRTISKSLADMPHLLVGGTTGSGKSVFLNVSLRALIAQNSPEEMRLVLIDPKQVELTQFHDVPHLMGEVITEDLAAARGLHWLVEEMERRYSTLARGKYRTLDAWNEKHKERLPKIVVVVDEFADLMMQSFDAKEMEAIEKRNIRKRERALVGLRGEERAEAREKVLGNLIEKADEDEEFRLEPKNAIIRLAQKARAVGIHLILATQKPTVDVVPGLIKANMPTRIAFLTTSRKESEIILDETGAEELSGKGDMLFKDPNVKGLKRLQAFYA